MCVRERYLKSSSLSPALLIRPLSHGNGHFFLSGNHTAKPPLAISFGEGFTRGCVSVTASVSGVSGGSQFVVC